MVEMTFVSAGYAVPWVGKSYNGLSFAPRGLFMSKEGKREVGVGLDTEVGHMVNRASTDCRIDGWMKLI